MRIGDLVKYGGNGQLYVVTETNLEMVEYGTPFIKIVNIKTGKSSQLPPHWITKIKTDNFCP